MAEHAIPLTYSKAAQVAEDITLDELDELVTANSEVYIFPRPRGWRWRARALELVRIRDGAEIDFARLDQSNTKWVLDYVWVGLAAIQPALFTFPEIGRTVRVTPAG